MSPALPLRQPDNHKSQVRDFWKYQIVIKINKMSIKTHFLLVFVDMTKQLQIKALDFFQSFQPFHTVFMSRSVLCHAVSIAVKIPSIALFRTFHLCGNKVKLWRLFLNLRIIMIVIIPTQLKVHLLTFLGAFSHITCIVWGFV